MQIETSDDGVVFVRDDWKAPQWSFETPLAFMRDARANRKVVVIGTISDSPKSPSQRYAIAVRQALDVADLVVLVGVNARGAQAASSGGRKSSFLAFARIEDAAQFLRTELRPGDLVLLKGTNKQDHLVRLLLDRGRPVQCWESACARNDFCGSCPMLYARFLSRNDAPPGPEDRSGAPKAPKAPKAPIAPVSRAPGRSLVVVGLGNPHSKYRNTPHNVGHHLLDTLTKAGGQVWEEQSEGLVSAVELSGVPVQLLKPGADINLSGPLVQRFLDRMGATAADCIVVHDDMDLELGNVRAKRDGGDGGHKGVKSVIVALRTDGVQRLRIGVRRAGDTRKAKDTVLERFSRADETALAPALKRAEVAIRATVKALSQESLST